MSDEFSIPEGLTIPEEFYKIMQDFILDVQNTFPEYNGIIEKWWKKDTELDKQRVEKQKLFLFRHCIRLFPERFFDILYKNEEMFLEDNDINTEFLPGIVFKQIWNCDISDTTKEVIWKYLQLILFSIIGSVHDKSQFGDTFKLFESINEDDWKAKLQETLEGMQTLFENKCSNTNETNANETNANETNANTNSNTNSNPFPIPNAEDIQNHLNGIMEGKLGKLAMELAEETAQNLNIDMENVTNTQDVFKKLFANPGKLMSMVKNVGGKIDEKIKSGEIKESELISEGVDMLNKMKNMPGMENMQELFSKMNIPGLGKNVKLNTGAMEAQMNKNLKLAQMKERMKMKADKKNANTNTNTNTNTYTNANAKPLTDEQLISIFSTGETVEKSLRGAKPKDTNDNGTNGIDNGNANKKKKKNKK
jgi:hypothetical protein